MSIRRGWREYDRKASLAAFGLLSYQSLLRYDLYQLLGYSWPLYVSLLLV